MLRFRSRSLVMVVALLLTMAMGAGTATGIVYGDADGDGHPYVGSIVVEAVVNGEEISVQWCSGTLLDGGDERDVFLTAAHCVFDFDFFVDVFDAEMKVTFDSTIDHEAGTFHDVDAINWHPRFGNNMADLFDVAVLEFEGKIDVGGYGALPAAGALDDMKKSGELKHQQFTAVGYGDTRDSQRLAFDGIDDSNLDRNRADQGFLSLTKAWLTLSMNKATGNGGTCYGDSGGPHFLSGSNVVASITVTGDAPCKATDKTYRMDTASARDFLVDFVTLP